MKLLNKNQGITLIALVITIIVILILAGISITMLTGDNGILTRAAEAKEVTGVAEIKEKISLAVLQALADSRTGIIEEEDLISALDEYFGSEGYTITDDDDGSGWIVIVDGNAYSISNTGDVVDPVAPEETTEDTSVTFSTLYASIDVIWLDTSNKVISSPNEPVLSSDMTKVTWTYDNTARNMDRR